MQARLSSLLCGWNSFYLGPNGKVKRWRNAIRLNVLLAHVFIYVLH